MSIDDKDKNIADAVRSFKRIAGKQIRAFYPGFKKD